MTVFSWPYSFSPKIPALYIIIGSTAVLTSLVNTVSADHPQFLNFTINFPRAQVAALEDSFDVTFRFKCSFNHLNEKSDLAFD